MGQARLRGTPDQRKQAAIDKQLSLRPVADRGLLSQDNLAELQAIGISGMTGIDAAFAAHCPHCDHDTFAIKGEREAVARMHMAIEDATNSASQPGVVPSASVK